MNNLAPPELTTLSLLGHSFQINFNPIFMTWVVMALLLLMAYLATRTLRSVPNTGQNLVEVVYDFVEDLTLTTLGQKEGKSFVPFIFTIFSFILLANWIGVIPNIAQLLGIVFALIHNLFGADSIQIAVDGITQINLVQSSGSWYSFLFKIPHEEPTRSVNTDLAIALVVFIVVHFNGIWKKGIAHYLKGYWGDVIPCKGYWLLLAPVNIMIPLNIISELSSVISHSFRLFGNIFGGFMIVTIVSSLVQFLAVPIALQAFFGLFSGLVQAFVFTMLAITYIGQKV